MFFSLLACTLDLKDAISVGDTAGAPAGTPLTEPPDTEEDDIVWTTGADVAFPAGKVPAYAQAWSQTPTGSSAIHFPANVTGDGAFHSSIPGDRTTLAWRTWDSADDSPFVASDGLTWKIVDYLCDAPPAYDVTVPPMIFQRWEHDSSMADGDGLWILDTYTPAPFAVGQPVTGHCHDAGTGGPDVGRDVIAWLDEGHAIHESGGIVLDEPHVLNCGDAVTVAQTPAVQIEFENYDAGSEFDLSTDTADVVGNSIVPTCETDQSGTVLTYGYAP